MGMRMTLYRMQACDDFTKIQAQYALAAHQEEVKREGWFLEFIINRLYMDIKPKLELLDIGPVEWTAATEEWEYVGDGQD